MTIRPLSCPQCGSPDLDELSWNRRRCRHCGTESVLTSDRTRLQLVEWVCPTCGFNNESGATYCGQCGATLVKQCPVCENEMRIDLQFCNFCGANYEAVLAERFEQRRQRAIAALEKSRKGQATKLWPNVILGLLVVFVLVFLVLCFPLLFVVALVENSLGRGIPALWLIVICVPPLAAGAAAIWVARRTRSAGSKRIDEEFASQRQALEESLAQEYAEMGLSEEGSQPSS